jgi:aspartyl-tRNA(Asn)/glutamyl-tRNA(Gln) amidotransferase subunit A
MIAEMGAALRRGEKTVADLVQHSLNRAEHEQPRLNAFITMLADRARERAAALDSELARGTDRGPLHGIPIAVKDIVHMRGIRTTSGSRVFENLIAEYDATVVARLEQAGAVIIGKTGLHEHAYGITSNNPHFGAVCNPHDPTRIPGGSSGGSGAAVAAGIVPIAIGTDTGGSVRIPASFCGCVGLKVTYGRVSKRGVLPLGFSLDTIGPLAATVDDAAIAMDAMAGRDLDDPTTANHQVPSYRPAGANDLTGLLIGRPDRFFFDRLSPGVAKAIQRAFETAASMGAEIVPVPVPDFEEINGIARIVLLAEAAASLQRYHSQRELFGTDTLALLDQGSVLPATAYLQAQRRRRELIREFADVWKRVDVLFTPCTPTTAPLIGATQIDVGGRAEDVRLASTRLVRGVNLLGLPALSIPSGPDDTGLPTGLQIIGPSFSEPLLLRTAAALNQ